MRISESITSALSWLRRHRAYSLVLVLTLSTLLSGCGLGYLVKSAYNQVGLLRRRVPIEEALKDPKISDEYKRKLLLARKAREYGERRLGLKSTKNYTSFAQLDGPYVTYVVSAAPKDKLEPHLWRYPMVGKLPYRGYFDKESAIEEGNRLKEKGLDVYVRGVSAYSTLGWFRDPILSSMLDYSDHDLVNTILHETVHATIYIKSEADFNERLATYIGNKGTEMFYRDIEGQDSPTIRQIENEAADDHLFSEFISAEIKDLESWYTERAKSGKEFHDSVRRERLKAIQDRFKEKIKPQLRSDAYARFADVELNNARLLNYKLYFQDLSDFEAVFKSMNGDFPRFLAYCKSLESVEDPEKALVTTTKPQPN